MENLTGGTPPVRYLLCVVPCKLYFKAHKNMVISMANLLYKITLDDKDKKLLAKSLRKNKEFLSSVQMTKKEFDVEDLAMIERALKHRYRTQSY